MYIEQYPTIESSLIGLGLQSRFGGKLLNLNEVCPQDGTAVLNGSCEELRKTKEVPSPPEPMSTPFHFHDQTPYVY